MLNIGNHTTIRDALRVMDDENVGERDKWRALAQVLRLMVAFGTDTDTRNLDIDYGDHLDEEDKQCQA